VQQYIHQPPITTTSLSNNPLLPNLDNIDFENLSDEYIVALLLKEAEESKFRAERIGVLGYLGPEKPRSNVPNKTFLSNMVKNTLTFNRSVEEAERREKDRRKLKEKREKEREKHHKERSEKYNKNKSDNEPSEEKGEDFKKRKRRSVEELQSEKKENGDEELLREFYSTLEEETPMIGPTKPPPNNNYFLLKTKVRGRGSVGSNMLDQYFAPGEKEALENAPRIQQNSQEKSKKQKKHKKEKKKKKKSKNN